MNKFSKSLTVLCLLVISCTTLSLEAKTAQNHKQKHRNKQSVQAKISPTALTHIKQRHWHQANSGSNTSHFNQSMTTQKLNSIATRTLNQGQASNSKNGQGRKVHDYTFKKPIGKTTSGSKAYSMRVVSDGQGNVITAYPRK